MIERTFFIFSLALLSLALLLAGCFNPDYGEVGFACKDNGCPEGYGCVPHGNTWRCKKGARDQKKDLKIKDAGDGGARDSADDLGGDGGFDPPGSLKCSTPVPVNSQSLRVKPSYFDMATDDQDRPYLVYVDAIDSMELSYISVKGSTAWKHSKAGEIGTGGRVSAAVDSQHNLHIAHIDTKHEVHSKYSYIESIKDGNWTDIELYSKNKALDVTLDARPVGTSVPWYIVHAEDSSSKGLMVVGRLNGNYGVDNFCEAPAANMLHPILAVGWSVGSNQVRAATSHFGETGSATNKGWMLGYYEKIHTKCDELKPADCGCPDHPRVLAVDPGGQVHAALSKVVIQERGHLNYEQWNGDKAFSGNPVIDRAVVDPLSLHISVGVKHPCISFYANGGGPGRVSMRVACWSGSAWMFSSPANKVSKLVYFDMNKNRANLTRVAVDTDKSANKVQVAFTTQSKVGASPELMYFTCELP